MDKIRFGLIGLGSWARNVHIPNLNQMEAAEIAAICARGEASREAALKACNGRPKSFADYRDLLASSDVDAVIVATPNGTHAGIACEALRAGKHVLCEKPMGLSVRECDEVIQVAGRSGRVFLIGHELRYAPVVREAKAIIARGGLGEVLMARADLMRRPLGMAAWRLDPAAYGGVMMDVGIHYLDLLCLLIGGRPRRASGVGTDATGCGYVNQCQALLEFDRALGAFGMCLYCNFGGEITIAALGREGRMEVAVQAGQIALYDYRANKKDLRSVPPPTGHKVYGFPGTYEALASFVECIRTGREPEAGAQVGREAVAVSLAAREAMRTGRAVEVDRAEREMRK